MKTANTDSPKNSVVGLFSSVTAADAAVSALYSKGFPYDNISFVSSESDATRGIGHAQASKSPEGATTGGVTGATIGGGLGLLAGLGALAIPGLGALVAAGPIMATLAGIGAGGATGAITGALVGLGYPEYEVKMYQDKIKDGNVLVSVHCDNSDQIERAKSVMKEHGGTGISSVGESKSSSCATNC